MQLHHLHHFMSFAYWNNEASEILLLDLCPHLSYYGNMSWHNLYKGPSSILKMHIITLSVGRCIHFLQVRKKEYPGWSMHCTCLLCQCQNDPCQIMMTLAALEQEIPSVNNNIYCLFSILFSSMPSTLTTITKSLQYSWQNFWSGLLLPLS